MSDRATQEEGDDSIYAYIARLAALTHVSTFRATTEGRFYLRSRILGDWLNDAGDKFATVMEDSETHGVILHRGFVATRARTKPRLVTIQANGYIQVRSPRCRAGVCYQAVFSGNDTLRIIEKRRQTPRRRRHLSTPRPGNMTSRRSSERPPPKKT